MTYSTMQIAKNIAKAIVADANLSHWFNTEFGKAVYAQVGAEMLQPLSEADAPYLVIFPEHTGMAPSGMKNSHMYTVVVSIHNKEWMNSDGVTVMQGLVQLDTVLPMLAKAISFALPSLRITEVEADFLDAQFPLLTLLVSLTIEETLPVGR